MTEASDASMQEAYRSAKLAAIFIDATKLTSEPSDPASIARFEAILHRDIHRFRGSGFTWWQHILSPLASLRLAKMWKAAQSSKRLTVDEFNKLRNAIAKLRYGQTLDIESHKLMDALRCTNILSEYMLRRFAYENGAYFNSGQLARAKVTEGRARYGTIFGTLLLFVSVFFLMCFIAAFAKFGFNNEAMLLAFWQWFATFAYLGYTVIKLSGVQYRLQRFAKAVFDWYVGIDPIEVKALAAQAPKRLLLL